MNTFRTDILFNAGPDIIIHQQTVFVTVYAAYKVTHGSKALATLHDQYVN
jgi:hypothetical protein